MEKINNLDIKFCSETKELPQTLILKSLNSGVSRAKTYIKFVPVAEAISFHKP